MTQLAEKIEIDYCNREVMTTEVRESCEIELLNIGESCIEAYDHYWGRHVQFNFIDHLDFDNLFVFNKVEVDKDQLFKLLADLDPTLFMTVKKIVLIQNKWDYNRLVKEFDGYEFLEGDELTHCLGKHLFFEGYVIINLMAMKKEISKMVRDAERDGYYLNESQEYNIGFWTTLIHELQHSRQANPLYENDYEGYTHKKKEDDAEQYCRNVFEDLLENRRYYILK